MSIQNLKPKRITLRKSFDSHLHWRVLLTLLRPVAKYSVRQFAGGLLMSNTGNPQVGTRNILTLKDLLWYREEVFTHLRDELKKDFLPVFTFYLSTELKKEDLLEAWNQGFIAGVKYYPKGGTTNSDRGLSGFSEVAHILSEMEKYGIPLLVHGETPVVNGEIVGDFKREKVFYADEAIKLRETFPGLPIVFEHITMGKTGHFVLAYENTYATITPQALLWDDRALFNGIVRIPGSREFKYSLDVNGMVPSRMCRPILKDMSDVEGLRNVLKLQAQKGLKKFGLGTDSAPHEHVAKYREGCACGIFSAPVALEMYAIAFEQMGILDHLPTFACDIMPEFYGIKDKLPEKVIILEPTEQVIPSHYEGIVTPFAGLSIPWTARELES